MKFVVKYKKGDFMTEENKVKNGKTVAIIVLAIVAGLEAIAIAILGAVLAVNLAEGYYYTPNCYYHEPIDWGVYPKEPQFGVMDEAETEELENTAE